MGGEEGELNVLVRDMRSIDELEGERQTETLKVAHF